MHLLPTSYSSCFIQSYLVIISNFFFIPLCFSIAQQPPIGSGSPHCRGFTMTLRHTTVDRTPVDERSARHKHLYLTTHINHKRQTHMPPAGFEPAVLASERP